MTFDFASLEPLINQILSAPGTDLKTVSAKRVRRELSNLDPSLTQEFLKEHKGQVDEVITKVYGQINAAQGEGNEASEEDADVYKYEEENEEIEEPEGDEETQVVDKKPKKGKKKLTDAEIARQLSSEINARSSSRRSTGKAKTNGTPKKARSKKSAATVDSDDDDGEPGGKKKSKSGGGAKGGFAKEYTLSTPLASLLQAEKMSRPQVVKQLWVYIKANGRQNPDNKREIVCDDALKAVFNVEKVDMFKMNKVLGQHLHDDNE